MKTSTLELGVIGNGSVSALIDQEGCISWCCLPAFDGDPAFCSLLGPKDHDAGYFAVELEDCVTSAQHYVENTAILVTVLHDSHGGAVEIQDFSPRFKQFGRIYHPVMLLRRIRPIAGSPRIRIRLRPLRDWGATVPERTFGSNHVRFLLEDWTLRVSTDAPIALLRDERPFVLDTDLHLVMGPDETLAQGVSTFYRDLVEQTANYWREWVRFLSIPVEWQEAVIRAAITLKLCQYEDSGAIVAAMTTSIPEHADSGRNWDYRYCWLRDATFVVRALNRLGATKSMEQYIRYMINIAAGRTELAPVYGIHYQHDLEERTVGSLTGFRGMGPVRVGNDAWRQVQHDVYGSLVLAASQSFYDHRLESRSGAATFARLVPMGNAAVRNWNQPDAGLWEYRGRARVHTYSSVMCWAACDRLARIAAHLGIREAAPVWRNHADTIRAAVLERSWSNRRSAFVEAAEDQRLDASALLFADLGFVSATDPRFVSTVETIGRTLCRGSTVFRYDEADDFGQPATAFNVCTFWYIDALASIGRIDEARDWFEGMLARRTSLGLLSEDIDPVSGEAWGNYPQTYSLVGLINAAVRLSRRWEDVV
ncbi:MAG: glycoside hydrolase family 15 protein [Burkholderiales bacterium]|nr:MAG: glycoside hydrolase family 15 protein [Burkholderiales bacterium]